ncbi:MAG: DUF1405 domain-containing protein [Candidatus Hydrothermarchaeaceae archaeon]
MKMRPLSLVLLANLFGSAFGFYYYQGLFLASPLRQGMFIPDSPASTIIFSSALILILLNKKNDWLSYASSVYVAKYGLWTLLVILYYSEYFLAPERRLFYITMFILHAGMVAQPLIVTPTINKNRKHLLLLPWFLLNDYMDYVVDTHPLFGYPFEDIWAISLSSVFSSVLLCILIHRISGSEKYPFSHWAAPKKSINRDADKEQGNGGMR